jgi:hypothetical protein
VLNDPVGYLRGLKARCGEDVCKTGLGGAVVVEVVDYLLARELFAKQEGSDTSRAGAG